MSKDYQDYIVSDKGLFLSPQGTNIVSKALWQQVVRLIEDQNPIPPIKRLLEKNPSFREQIQKADPLVRSLPTHMIQSVPPLPKDTEEWFQGFWGHFTSNLENEVTTPKEHDTAHRVLRKKQQWNWETFAQIASIAPDLTTIIKKVYPHTKRGALKQKIKLHYCAPDDAPILHHPPAIDVKSFNFSLKVSQALQSNLYHAHNGNIDSLTLSQKQGQAVCVFINEMGKFFTGSNVCQSIAGAKLYESLEAAKRSARAALPLQELTFVKVDVSFQAIACATHHPALQMKRVQAQKEKEDLTLALSPQDKPSSSKRKM